MCNVSSGTIFLLLIRMILLLLVRGSCCETVTAHDLSPVAIAHASGKNSAGLSGLEGGPRETNTLLGQWQSVRQHYSLILKTYVNKSRQLEPLFARGGHRWNENSDTSCFHSPKKIVTYFSLCLFLLFSPEKRPTKLYSTIVETHFCME